MKKERIAIIGAGCFQLPLIEKVNEMGFESHVFAWENGAVGKKAADFFYPVSITEKEAILNKCRELAVCAVVSIASDLAVSTANYVARELHCVSNSEECDRKATNKFEMRKALEDAGIPTPKFIKAMEGSTLKELKTFKLPVIVKPTDRSGSRAITKITELSSLENAIKEALEVSFEKAAIVEEFIEGKEFSCECISQNGQHHFLAITEKFTTGEPHYIEIGHIEPAILCEGQAAQIRNMVFKALDALKIENGASHCELKIDPEGNIGIIEIGARMGGDFIGSDLVKISTGMDFVKMVVDVATGKELNLEQKSLPGAAAVRYFMNEDEVLKFADFQKQYGKKIYRSEVEEHAGDKTQVTDSSTRLGYYIVKCETYEEARMLIECD